MIDPRTGIAHRNTSHGFTLVETLVAVTILMLVMVAFMTLARVGLTMSTFSKDRVIAYYLAQDAMQYIVNVHYADVQNNSEYFDNIIAPRCTGGCTIDTVVDNPAGNHIVSNCSPTCPLLRLNPAGGSRQYGYNSGWAQSNFTRTIVVQNISAYERSAVVTVSWLEEGGTSRSVTLRRHFFQLKDFLP